MPPPPRVFIGSSREGHHIAELLQLGLDAHAECTIWSQGVFGLGGGSLESLCDSARSFDFAILVLTPDDLIQKRDDLKRVPRDNVLFELGLFMGTLGRDSTFIVRCSDDQLELPSDLAGITTVQWRKRSDGNLRAALGPACTTIRLAIDGRAAKSPRASSEIDDLRALIQAQSQDLRTLVETINRGIGLKAPASAGDRSSERLAFLEGTWRNSSNGTTVYMRLINGKLRGPYCYGGNDSLAGEYYDVVRAGDILTIKFRWLLVPSIRGCLYFRIKSQDELVGGWWYAKDLDVETLRRHSTLSEGAVPFQRMVAERLERHKAPEVPGWVTEYYEAVRKAVPEAP